MGKLTTHVLDTAYGRPASGVHVRLLDEAGVTIAEAVTNLDGRCDDPLLEGDDFRVGFYRLAFAVGDYFRSHGVAMAHPAFFDCVEIAFGVADPRAHYHVPLLVSPFGYSTYRGS